ncbi:MAG: hypothetical protein ACFFCC_20205 [Promethearchaeota archaeon]
MNENKSKEIKKESVISKQCFYCRSKIENIDEPCPYCGFSIPKKLPIDEIDTEEVSEMIKVIVRKANIGTIKQFIKEIDAWLNSPHNDKILNVEVNKYLRALKKIWEKRL